MNSPLFDLPELVFFVFYFVMNLVVVVLIRWRFRQQESRSKSSQPPLIHPYEIAHLRAGPNECIRVAAFSLIHRGWLKISKGSLEAAPPVESDKPPRLLETTILNRFSSSRPIFDLYNNAEIQMAGAESYDSLNRHGLVADDAILAARRPLFAIGLFLILGLAFVGIKSGFAAGALQVSLLLGLALLFLFGLWKIYRCERSGLGERVLKDLQHLGQDLKARAHEFRPEDKNDDVSLVVAVFGLSVLSETHFPFLKDLKISARGATSFGNPDDPTHRSPGYNTETF